MKRYTRRQTIFLLAPLALGLQSCLSSGGGTTLNADKFITKGNVGGKDIGVSNKVPFKGKIYLTLARNLFVLDDQLHLQQLTRNMDVRDPAVSPDGKQVAFIQRQKDYSDLLVMSTDGGKPKALRLGKGQFMTNPYSDRPKNNFFWNNSRIQRENWMQILVLAGLYKETIPGWRQSGCLNDMFLTSLFSLKLVFMSRNYDMRERYHDRIIVW